MLASTSNSLEETPEFRRVAVGDFSTFSRFFSLFFLSLLPARKVDERLVSPFRRRRTDSRSSRPRPALGELAYAFADFSSIISENEFVDEFSGD